MTKRYFAILRGDDPLRGRCPACEQPMDDASCRIGGHWMVKPAARRRTGIAQVVEVFCAGTPTTATVECPACR